MPLAYASSVTVYVGWDAVVLLRGFDVNEFGVMRHLNPRSEFTYQNFRFVLCNFFFFQLYKLITNILNWHEIYQITNKFINKHSTSAAFILKKVLDLFGLQTGTITDLSDDPDIRVSVDPEVALHQTPGLRGEVVVSGGGAGGDGVGDRAVFPETVLDGGGQPLGGVGGAVGGVDGREPHLL